MLNMKYYNLIFFFFCIICVAVAIMNNILKNFGRWGKFNCKYYADQANYSDSLDEKFKQVKNKKFML